MKRFEQPITQLVLAITILPAFSQFVTFFTTSNSITEVFEMNPVVSVMAFSLVILSLFLGVYACVGLFKSRPTILTKREADDLLLVSLKNGFEADVHTKNASLMDDRKFRDRLSMIPGVKDRLRFVLPKRVATCDDLDDLGISYKILPTDFPELTTRFTILRPEQGNFKIRIASMKNEKNSIVEVNEYQNKGAERQLAEFADDLRKTIEYVIDQASKRESL